MLENQSQNELIFISVLCNKGQHFFTGKKGLRNTRHTLKGLLPTFNRIFCYKLLLKLGTMVIF